MDERSREAFFEELRTHRLQQQAESGHTVVQRVQQVLEEASGRDDVLGLTSAELSHVADADISSIKRALDELIDFGVAMYAGTIDSHDVTGRKTHLPIYAIAKKPGSSL